MRARRLFLLLILAVVVLYPTIGLGNNFRSLPARDDVIVYIKMISHPYGHIEYSSVLGVLFDWQESWDYRTQSEFAELLIKIGETLKTSMVKKGTYKSGSQAVVSAKWAEMMDAHAQSKRR